MWECDGFCFFLIRDMLELHVSEDLKKKRVKFIYCEHPLRSPHLDIGFIFLRHIFIPIPKKDNAKECSNYQTIAFMSHASKLMLKIL